MINFENIEALSALGANIKSLFKRTVFAKDNNKSNCYWWDSASVALAVSMHENMHADAVLTVELIHPKARPMPCCRIRFELIAARVTAVRVEFDQKVLANKSGPQPADLLPNLLSVLSDLHYSHENES